MTKNFKLVLALALAAMMIVSMIPAMAAEPTTKVTVTSTTEDDAKYAAYKLLNATNDATDKTKFAYTLNDKYTAILKSVSNKTSQADILEYIGGLDTDGIRTFADGVYAAIKAADPAIAADATADASGKTADFGALAQGYYLIAETTVGTVTTEDGTQTGSFSLVMLDTKGLDAVDVKTKEDVPSVKKKVEEKDDGTGNTVLQDAADFDIGDEINYQLTGTLSAKYGDYEKYYYEFHDTMNKLTYKNDSVKVYAVNGTTETEINAGYTVSWNADTKKLDVKFADLKTATCAATIDASTKIRVKYVATLDSDAVIGSAGNPNTVNLEYSNNPYDKGDGKPGTGTTPDDKNTVFTYKIVANKVKEDKTTALEGAGFTLYKLVKPAEGAATWTKIGDEITGVTTFNFTGKDTGAYKLEETTVPAGYNKAADIYFYVKGTYDTTSDDPKLTALDVYECSEAGVKGTKKLTEGTDATFTTAITGTDDGSAKTNVVNQSGVELPSTGGIGTTIFYVAGSLMVLAAAILLITKRRMGAND